MSDEELDPEIIADLRLRAATERDASRERPTSLRFEPCRTVRTLPCREPTCRKPCELSETGAARIMQFNRRLISLGEQPISEYQIMICPECRAHFVAAKGKRNRERIEESRKLIRALKDSKDFENEHAIWKRLEQMHHPDIHGLRESLRAGKLKSKAPSRKDIAL